MDSTTRQRIDAGLGKLGYVVGGLFVLALVIEPLREYVLPLLALAAVLVAGWSRL